MIQLMQNIFKFVDIDSRPVRAEEEPWGRLVTVQAHVMRMCYAPEIRVKAPKDTLHHPIADNEGVRHLAPHRVWAVKKENHSTQDSRMVPHRGTNWAALRLTAQIKRDAVLSESYGHGC